MFGVHGNYGRRVPTVRANGIDLYYERLGRGAPLLWLNGSGSTIAQIAPLLTPYSDHFEVLIHDQRGLGRTEVPAGPYTMADYAADALALLDDVGWERTRVLGISFGGMVAQELAVTAPGSHRAPGAPLHLAGRRGRVVLPAPRAGRRSRRRTERDATARSSTPASTRPGWPSIPNDKALVDLMGARPEPTEGAVLQLEARRHHDVWDRLDRVTCPTLVASGRYDGIAAPENGEAIASRIPGAELRLFEGGHMFMVQDRSATPAVIDFLLQDS